MPDYRLLIMDQTGLVQGHNTFSAITDRHAWEYVRVSFPTASSMELWCGTRQVDGSEQSRTGGSNAETADRQAPSRAAESSAASWGSGQVEFGK